MRAWTNKLFSLSHLLILSVSFIFAVFGIAIIHYQDSQTQSTPLKTVSLYATSQPGVQFQQAYVIPSLASDYIGDTSQQIAGNLTTKTSSTQATPQASNHSATENLNTQSNKSSSQSVNTDSNKSNTLSSDLNMILGTIGLTTK